MTNLRVEIKVFDPNNERIGDSLEGRMSYYRLKQLQEEFVKNGIETKIFWEINLDQDILREYYKLKEEIQR